MPPKWRWYGLGAVMLFAALQPLTGLFALADLKALDFQFRLLRAYFPAPAPEVVVIGIDEATVARLPEPLALWHHHLGKLVRGVARAKPAAIGVDIILPDRSFNAIVPGYDRQLLAGIIEARRNAPVVFGLTIGPTGATRNVYPPFLSAAGQEGVGYALWRLDMDGSVRWFDEALGAEGHAVATLSGQIARLMKTVPGRGLIDYSRGPRFDYLPFHDVLDWIDAGDGDKLERAFSGRPVLVGSVTLFEDRQLQPVDLFVRNEPGDRRIPGVLVHAQVLRSILGGTLIQPLPVWLAPALAMLAALFWLWPIKPLRAVVVTAGLVAGVFGGITALQRLGFFLPVSGLLATIAVALVGRSLADQAANALERLRLRRAFGAYVSPQIMDEIVGGRLSGSLGGDRRALCVLFADIRDFTTRSETLSPEAVITLLNRYFEEVTGAIHRHDGTVDKFIGDGIMAFFGAPKALANPSAAAVAAAQEMLDRLAGLNETLAQEGQTPIRIGIGLHAGDAVVGHVGSTARHEYTAIGDTVNLASRIESLTKEVGYPLVCSEAVMHSLDSTEGFVNLGAKPVKGHTPVIVYGWPAQAGQPSGKQSTT
ncbi:MAG: adenylate/guanylate cyclase domain-containing protein [Rhodocyclales bacterium]|nr:adenylate/guanylate cyclase domain-containing protein [Rhodocyclales bacterium]